MHGPLREVVEGAFGVNHMADGKWRDEKELVGSGTEAHIQFQLIQWKKLTLGCLAGLHREGTQPGTFGGGGGGRAKTELRAFV